MAIGKPEETPFMMSPMRRRRRVQLAVAAVLGLALIACLASRSRGPDELAYQRKLARWGGRSQGLFENSRLNTLRPVLGDASYSLIVAPRGRRIGNDAGPDVRVDATREQLGELLEVQPFTVARLSGSKNIDDDWLAWIEEPSDIEVLHLSGSAITDKSVPTLLEMTSLKNLELVDTAISDAAIERLRRLPRLRRSCFGGPNVRSIRLIEPALVDDRGIPTVRGKIRADRFGMPMIVRVFARTALDGPPTRTNPYGWDTRIRATGRPTAVESGLWEFSIALPWRPEGPCTIETWVEWTSLDSFAVKLEAFQVEAIPPPTGKAGEDRPGPFANPPR